MGMKRSEHKGRVHACVSAQIQKQRQNKTSYIPEDPTNPGVLHIPEMTPNLRGLHFCGTTILTHTVPCMPVHLYVVLATAAAVVLLACPETSCRNRQYKVDRYSLTQPRE